MGKYFASESFVGFKRFKFGFSYSRYKVCRRRTLEWHLNLDFCTSGVILREGVLVFRCLFLNSLFTRLFCPPFSYLSFGRIYNLSITYEHI